MTREEDKTPFFQQQGQVKDRSISLPDVEREDNDRGTCETTSGVLSLSEDTLIPGEFGGDSSSRERGVAEARGVVDSDLIVWPVTSPSCSSML